MKIEGYDDDQIAAILKMWKLDSPIDVQGFLDRADISNEAKEKVTMAGDPGVGHSVSDTDGARLYRLMQAQVIIEVVKLDKQRWNPFSSAKDN